MASWNDWLREAREASRLSRQALAERAGVSPETIYSYEAARRAPQRETLRRLARALELDGARANAILEDAGFEPEVSPWVRQGRIEHRPFAELQPELDDYTWPCLALNERFEIVAWNVPAVRVAELDFGRELPELHQRNLLRIAAMGHFRRRVVNWDEVVSVMVGMYKGHHMGPEDLAAGSTYFQAVVEDILRQDPEIVERLARLWQDTPAAPQSARIVFPVQWQPDDGRPLAFNCVIAGWSEFDGIGVHDWHPADAATWSWLAQDR